MFLPGACSGEDTGFIGMLAGTLARGLLQQAAWTRPAMTVATVQRIATERR
jgi:hypothetical protein